MRLCAMELSHKLPQLFFEATSHRDTRGVGSQLLHIAMRALLDHLCQVGRKLIEVLHQEPVDAVVHLARVVEYPKDRLREMPSMIR